MAPYFKLVCLHDDPSWIIDEFQNGRVRFGWSPPGTDLRELTGKDPNTRSDQEELSWKKGKFLIERIRKGHRVVVQPDQPIDRFLIGDVIGAGYEFDPDPKEDFNHILHVRPCTPVPIPVNSKEVSTALKFDLTKRGRYYEIFSERSLEELDCLVSHSEDGTLERDIVGSCGLGIS